MVRWLGQPDAAVLVRQHERRRRRRTDGPGAAGTSARLQAPPWGRLHAIDLVTGDIAWQVPLGDAPQLAARGITGTGTPNLGGSVATAGGLVFIGGANDRQLRAFDAKTGRVVWHAELPASGHATPLVYRAPASGHAIVVIAAGGGGRFSSAVSDAIVAFALGQ